MSAAETTPTEKSDAVRRGGYLPVLPDGWEYDVRLIKNGSGATQVTVGHRDGDDAHYAVLVQSSDGVKRLRRDNLPEALRVAVDAAKGLERLARTEAEYAAARKAVLDSIGGEGDEDEEPEPEPGPEPEPTTGLTRDPGPTARNADDEVPV